MKSFDKWSLFILFFVSTCVKSELKLSTHEELVEMKRQWDKCCESNVCINNSCYMAELRASTWPATRQRCQGRYPDWPDAVDIFRLQKQQDIASISKLFLPVEESGPPRTSWTSGTRCPKTGPEGPLLVTRWTSTNQSFPDWIEEKINSTSLDIPEKNEGCKFLVVYPSPNSSDIQFDFQDQTARHAAICEFLFPVDDANKPRNVTYDDKTIVSESTTLPFTGILPVESASMKLANKNVSILTTFHYFTSHPISTFKTSQSVSYASTLSTPTILQGCKGKTAFGIDWPDALPGEVISISCPEGLTGFAQWKCSRETLKFTPAKPYIHDCKHTWIKHLEEEIDNGNDSVIISGMLANETQSQELSHGDITALVDLSMKLLHLYVKQSGNQFAHEDKPLSFNFTTSMVTSMSNILRAEIKSAWEFLPQIHQTRAASNILKLVSTMGSHLSCIRKSHENLQFTVTTENIGLQTFILNSSVSYESDLMIFPQPADGVETKSYISLPVDEALKNSFSQCKNYKAAVGVIYNHVGDFLKDENLRNSSQHVATKVIAFTFSNDSESSISLPPGKEVTMVLQHTSLHDIRVGKLSNPYCVFWNFSKQPFGEWDSSGCVLIETNLTHSVCSCDHLTNFAILMDVNNNIEEDQIMSLMTYVCCGISSLTLSLTLICFIMIRSLHGRRSIITGNLCFSLLITNLLIIFGLDQTENKIVCAAIAGFLHFWILSAFCWMLIEGYHLYRMVVLIFEQGRSLSVKCYYIFAYGCPLVIVGISASVRSDDYGGMSYCWLSFKKGLMWSFVGPACFVILVNIMIFILTLRSAASVRIKKEQTTIQKIKAWARGSLSVMCLLGLTWFIGFFYIEKRLHAFSYIFILLNGSQGIFIFLFHVVLNEKAQNASCCKGVNRGKWKKFLPQSSSNRYASKTSTRTSLNSNRCGSQQQVLTAVKQPSIFLTCASNSCQHKTTKCSSLDKGVNCSDIKECGAIRRKDTVSFTVSGENFSVNKSISEDGA